MKQVPMATPSISIKVVPTSRGNTVESKWGHTFSVGENANQITNKIGIAIVIETMTAPSVHAPILFTHRPGNGNKLLYLNSVIIRSSKGSLRALSRRWNWNGGSQKSFNERLFSLAQLIRQS
jgi:hypothetical protein